MAITHSDTITSLMKALHAVQGQVDGVAKDAKNPHFKNSYASLEAVVDAIREPCQRAGLVVMQAPGECLEGTIAVSTMISHAESGEWVKSTVQIPLAKNDPQGAGSAITYASRYSLMALFNLPPVDDDANAATQGRPQAPAQAPRRDAPRPTTNAAPEPSVSQETTVYKQGSGMAPPPSLEGAIHWMRKNTTTKALDVWLESNQAKIDALNEADRKAFQKALDQHRVTLLPNLMAG